LAIRAQDKGPNFVGIANEGTAELFSMQIPNFDGVVPTADESAHLDSGQRTKLIRHAQREVRQFSSAEIPKFDRLVSTATKRFGYPG